MSQEEHNPYLYHAHTILGTTKPSGDQGDFQVTAQGKQPTFENQVSLSEAYRHESLRRNRRTKTNRATEQVDEQEDTDLPYLPSIDHTEGITLT